MPVLLDPRKLGDTIAPKHQARAFSDPGHDPSFTKAGVWRSAAAPPRAAARGGAATVNQDRHHQSQLRQLQHVMALLATPTAPQVEQRAPAPAAIRAPTVRPASAPAPSARPIVDTPAGPSAEHPMVAELRKISADVSDLVAARSSKTATEVFVSNGRGQYFAALVLLAAVTGLLVLGLLRGY